MRSRGRDANIPGMLRPGGRGMPERGEFQDGRGGGRGPPRLWGGKSRNLRAESQMGRMALTASVQLELGRNTDLVSERYNPSGDIRIFIVGNQNVSAFH